MALLLLLVALPIVAFDPRDGFDGYFWLKVRLILVLVAGLALWWAFALRSDHVRVERASPLLVVGLGLLVWATMSTVFSANPGVGVWGAPGRDDGLLVLGANLLVFATACTLVDGRQRRLLYRVTAGVALLVSAYAVAQHFGVDANGLPLAKTYTRSTGTFRNPLSLAGYLALILPLAAVTVWQVRGRLAALFASCGLGVMLAALVCAYGRAGWLGTGFAIALLLTWVATTSRSLLPHALVTLGIAVAVAAGIMALPRAALPGTEVHSIRSDASRMVSAENPRNQGRLAIWAISLAMIKDRPLFGVGPDQMGEQFEPYRTAAFDADGGPGMYADRAHSEPLNLAVTLGIPGALFAMALVFCAFLKGFGVRMRRLGRGAGIWQVAVACGLIGYIAQSLASITVPGIHTMFYVLLGCLVAGGISREKGGERLCAHH